MRDKLLTYALAISIVFHVGILCMVGKTSAAKPIEVDQLKVVSVDLVKTPDQVNVKQDLPETKQETAASQSEPETPYIPPVSKMVTAKEPRTQHQERPQYHQPSPRNNRNTVNSSRRIASSRLPGDPGGALGGVASPNGQDLGRVASGGTPVGWVSGSDNGRGIGSGSGAGVGRPDPVPDAHPGPGVEPAPEPPQPRYVSIIVCSDSEMLPGMHCDHKETKSFREGSEPSRICTRCKAPEPKHVSRLADRSEPELVKDSEIRLPDLDESGSFEVKVRWTVKTDGSVSDVEVTKSSGVKALDRAVCDAVSKRKYKPAVQDGEPRSVNMKQRVPIRF